MIFSTDESSVSAVVAATVSKTVSQELLLPQPLPWTADEHVHVHVDSEGEQMIVAQSIDTEQVTEPESVNVDAPVPTLNISSNNLALGSIGTTTQLLPQQPPLPLSLPVLQSPAVAAFELISNPVNINIGGHLSHDKSTTLTELSLTQYCQQIGLDTADGKCKFSTPIL